VRFKVLANRNFRTLFKFERAEELGGRRVVSKNCSDKTDVKKQYRVIRRSFSVMSVFRCRETTALIKELYS